MSLFGPILPLDLLTLPITDLRGVNVDLIKVFLIEL